MHQRYRDSNSEPGHAQLGRRDSELITQSDDVIVRQNADRGLDIIVKEKGVVKSARQGTSIRYGFIPPTGESHDIRSLLEEEWRALGDDAETHSRLDPNDDILDALCRKPSPVLRQSLERIMSRAQHDTFLAVPPRGLRDEDPSPSIYSESGTQVVSPLRGKIEITPSRSAYLGQTTRAVPPNEIIRDVTSMGPMQAGPNSMLVQDAMHTQHNHETHPSISSINSDLSQYTSGSDTQMEVLIENMEKSQEKGVSQDSGLSRMLAMIELEADLSSPPPLQPAPMIDRYFLGIPLSLDTLHPAARGFFEPSFRRLDDAEQVHWFLVQLLSLSVLTCLT